GPNILSTKPIGTLPAGWTVAGSDNRGAIFLRNMTTGDVGVWVIGCTKFNVASNSTSCSPVNTIDFGPVPLSWQIVGIGDFDGNGSSDILFKDSSNNVGIWLLETNDQTIKILSTSVLGAVPAGWNVALTGDFNGVGKADVLWMDGSGNVGAWAMNGTAISAVVSFGNVGTTWSVQGLNAE
ncbi:MAG: VCBS repeat-containing protein, partial [Xanthobacteraceae bacterium]